MRKKKGRVSPSFFGQKLKLGILFSLSRASNGGSALTREPF